MQTKYAPAERSSLDIVQEQATWFMNVPLLNTVLNCLPDIVFIVNENRQIVFANSSGNSTLTKITINQVLGKRVGEVLNCEHSLIEEGGCGTSEFCRTCGAVNAILTSLKGTADEQECRISQRGTHESLDLRVYTSPIEVNGSRFSVFAVSDISNEKRRKALERIFFHDIINTAGGLRGISEIMQSADDEEMTELKGIMLELSEKILEDIQTQKELSVAENGELSVNPTLVNSTYMINLAIKSLKNHIVGKGKEIEISPDSEDFVFKTDKRLLRRILVNLVKNALEASDIGGKVIISALKKEMTEFNVWNLSFIPKVIQNQIFQRSFSTKGSGRGLGTYSIKLLTEKYLNGKVSFNSSKESGTEFKVMLPTEI